MEGSVSSSQAIHVSCIAIAANFCSGKNGRVYTNIGLDSSGRRGHTYGTGKS
jgi:hypothetical protein